MGRCHHPCQQQSQGINQGMMLATFDPLVAVKAYILMLGGHLDRLTIRTARRGIVFSPLAAAFPGAKGVHEIGPHALLAPATKIPVEGHALAQVTWHQAPLTTGFIDIENTIDNTPQIERRARASHRPALAFRRSPIKR